MPGAAATGAAARGSTTQTSPTSPRASASTWDYAPLCPPGDYAHHDTEGCVSDSKAAQNARKHELQQKLVELKGKERETADALQHLREYVSNEEAKFASRVKDVTATINEVEEELTEMTATARTVAYPGVASLAFVEHVVFRRVSAFVALASFFRFFVYLAHFDGTSFCPVSPLFLTFYVVEATLKILLFRQEYVVASGTCKLWNWTDLAIIVSCSATYYCDDVLFGVVVRLLQLAKVARAFNEWDTSFCMSPAFESFMMCVISCNSICMAFEDSYPHCIFWTYLNTVMLVTFLFELVARLKAQGLAFFYTEVFWNLLDFAIVMGGLMDLAGPIVTAYVATVERGEQHHKRTGALSSFMMMLRLARLLRVLRLVKLLRKIKPLYTLVVGITEAMQGMGWVVVLTVVWLYIGALCFVKLVGQGLVFGGIQHTPEDIKELFPNVPAAMWVLFKVMNGDPNDLEGLFQVRPLFKLVIAIFMIISSWAILSILTAVVSDYMIEATKKFENSQRNETAERTRVRLARMFDDGDVSGDAMLTEKEFFNFIDSDAIRQSDVCDAAKMDAMDMHDLFYVLSTSEADDDGSRVPCIDKESFIDGVMNFSLPVTHRTLFRLEKRLATVMREEARESHKALTKMMEQMSSLFKNVTENLETRMDEISAKVEKADDSLQACSRHVRVWDTQVESLAHMQRNADIQLKTLQSAVSNIEGFCRISANSAGDVGPEPGATAARAALDAKVHHPESEEQRRVIQTAAFAEAGVREADAAAAVRTDAAKGAASSIEGRCRSSSTFVVDLGLSAGAIAALDTKAQQLESVGRQIAVKTCALAEDASAVRATDEQHSDHSSCTPKSPTSTWLTIPQKVAKIPSSLSTEYCASPGSSPLSDTALVNEDDRAFSGAATSPPIATMSNPHLGATSDETFPMSVAPILAREVQRYFAREVEAAVPDHRVRF